MFTLMEYLNAKTFLSNRLENNVSGRLWGGQHLLLLLRFPGAADSLLFRCFVLIADHSYMIVTEMNCPGIESTYSGVSAHL